MPSDPALPGLEHLLEVCRRQHHPVKLEPPRDPRSHPVASSVAGQTMDPHLAALHARLRYLWVKDELYVFPERHERRPDLHAVNTEWREDWDEPFGSLLVFAKDDRLAYCYAAVPRLVDARGLRPVVWVDVYEALYAIPVASSIDQFLDTFARHLEGTPVSPGREDEALPLRAFPWSAGEVIARDRVLVERVRAGDFDFLLQQNASAREWVQTRLGGAVRR